MHEHIHRANEREERTGACPLRRGGSTPVARRPHTSPGCVRVALALAATLPGCKSGPSLPPSIVLLGASFPDWLFCIVGGVVAAAVVHMTLARARRLAWLSPAALIYPALTALFAALAWLLLFRR